MTTHWDGRPLAADVIGLAWPGPPDPGVGYAAAGGGPPVRVPAGHLADFLAAHPRAGFAADLAGPHPFRPGDAVVNENRLYDINLLSNLAHSADLDLNLPVPENPAGFGWEAYSESVRSHAVRLLGCAERAAGRAGADTAAVGRFGPLGIGLEVRSAVAVTGGGVGFRIVDSRLPRLQAALDRRQTVARRELENCPAAKKFANKPGTSGFLDRGHAGDNVAARMTFIDDFIYTVRRRDGLPVPFPTETADLHAWEFLAPHHRVVAAWLELAAVADLRESLTPGGVVWPRVSTFPELRTTGPDLSYLRRLAGAGALSPAGSDSRLLVVRVPDLELRTLAVCLERRHGDGELARRIRDRGTPEVRQELVRRVSGLSVEAFIPHLTGQSAEYRLWDAVGGAALKYFPRGVTNRTLETWLVEYESGVVPRAAQVAAAWDGFRELAPSLADYSAADVTAIVAENLGVSAGELTAALAERAAGFGLDPAGADIPTVLDIMLRDTQSDPRSPGNRAVSFFATEQPFLENRLATGPYRGRGELIRRMLGSDHMTPTGRVYGDAMPLQSSGTDHLELADGVRKALLYALAAAGFRVAGFAGDEVAVLVPDGGTAESHLATARQVAEDAISGLLYGLQVGVGCAVTSEW